MSNDYLNLLALLGIGGAHPGGFALTKSILENEHIHPSESVLDIGCGTGQTAHYLTQRFACQVTALDNHPIMLAKAKERFQKSKSPVIVVEGDVQKLDFPTNSFDMILAESVIAFTDISKTLHELSRVLKSTGRLILIEMTAEHPMSQELMEKVYNLYGIREVPTEKDWITKLGNVGFTKIDVLNTSFGLIQTDIADINQSENIGRKFFDIWDEHNRFTIKNNESIGFRAFRCCL
ncbi:class I SAM-dependent methyltransferase [Filibacter tadaridae]|uniref:Glycine/sarcosine/dimethylglycine N-methyltransferase n=1 Tax=Filibacter tadaridae TaxID=2483811 RepID=A0A3P5WTL7_9BACL|nr:class I SAM-dependent methyltransferase [Filibacter tadaridae]VDC22641.1 Glycine/sarcosine/dimethylglycine N-methyltransferase [Filibacter tadaridae]